MNRTTAQRLILLALAAISFGALGGCDAEGDLDTGAGPGVFILGDSNITLGAGEGALFRGDVAPGPGAAEAVLGQLSAAGQVLTGTDAADGGGYVQIFDVTGPEAFDCLVLEDGEIDCTPLPAVAEDERLLMVTTLAPTDDPTEPGYLPSADLSEIETIFPDQGRVIAVAGEGASYYPGRLPQTLPTRLSTGVSRFTMGRVQWGGACIPQYGKCPFTPPDETYKKLALYYLTTFRLTPALSNNNDDDENDDD